MASNFDFLKTCWTELHADATEAERNAFSALRTAIFYARRSLELAVRWMYRNDGDLKAPYQKTLAAMLHEPTFKNNLPPNLFKQTRLIQRMGNIAVHSDQAVHRHDGLQAVKSLHAVLGWVAKIYSVEPPTVAAFNETLIPAPSAASNPDKNAAQLAELERKLAAKDNAFEAAQVKLTTTEAEVERLKKHIAEIKAANEQRVHDEDYSEEETRDLFIDLMLREAGWDPKALNVAEYPVTGMPYGTGDGFVDYVLWGKDGLPLAVVEAKRTKKSPQAGKQQAKLYADCLERMKGQRPVIFYTNGYDTWLWDDTIHPPRQVQGFYNQDELQLMVHRRTSRNTISTEPVSRAIINRYYQEEAVRKVMEHFEQDNARKALVVMATGSGKTRTAIAMVDILMKANWVRRVLFLADRNALVRQAKNAFSAHLPHASVVNLVEEREKDDSRIVFSTYPNIVFTNGCFDILHSGHVYLLERAKN
ncbi:MAG: DEAD/DEAH box helicase family protein [Candidatus Heimdallarchaeaceae archaeon]